ncbi:hypothetical protein [Hymenobacter jeollabukensis]|uniref:DUF1735 domain-containing protein n=1 Tax=Hymenobacter jeollabukensis TaxID=2025313 RepID=A0A5R8WWV8_9BACT|nr:hypothetical protein [Hymenobacter jeollabukensis]TLM97010.1 hypothetical protein FDY95_03195 [Hymenobacter jeollabukensis]
MKLNLICSLLAGGLLFAACSKDQIDCTPAPTDDHEVLTNASLTNSFVRKYEAPAQSFTVNPAPGATASFVTAKGARVTVPYGAFVQADGVTPATGAVQLTVREILRKPDMVLSAMPTVSNGEILVSGGQYYLRATQNNARLRLKPSARLYIKAPNPVGQPDYAMRLFFGSPMANGSVNWTPQPQQNPSTISVDSLGQGNFYNLTLNNDSLGWINCDRFANINPKTTVTATIAVPAAEVEPGNTMVFWVFNSINSVARGYVTTGQNTVTTPNMPVGLSVTAVVIRLVNGQYYFGKQTATVAANQQYAPTLRALSEADLLAEVQQL